jgi:hydroxymethylpyrimidine/phosphomethylpyrimidine kinase
VKQYGVVNLVVDPVMMSTSGARLMNPDALAAFRQALLPLASLVTPNLAEVSVLTGKIVGAIGDMRNAALRIHDMGARRVLIKGGHLDGSDATDLFFDGEEFLCLRVPRLDTRHTHGTGCVLSAAIAGYLALGEPIARAVGLGKEFVTKAIKNALQMGNGTGPCDPLSLGG